MKTGPFFLLIALLLPSAAMAQATIKGQVTDLMTDKPLPGVRVDLRTAENTEPVVHREVWTDARGRYRLDDVAAGRWRVRALLMMPDADRILVSPPAEVSRKSTVFHFKFSTGRQHRPAGAGILSQEFLDTPSSDKIEVTGRVVDAFTAVPLAGATVRLMTPKEATTGGMRYQTQGKARTDRQGHYHIENLEAGDYLIHISRASYDTLRNAVTSISASTRMDLALLATDRPKLRLPILGRVKDARGRNLDGISASFKPFNGIGGQLSGRIKRGDQPAADATILLLNSPFHTRTDADGFFVFPRLPLRSYRFRLIHDGETLETAPLGIEAGPSEINFNLDQPPRGQD